MTHLTVQKKSIDWMFLWMNLIYWRKEKLQWTHLCKEETLATCFQNDSAYYYKKKKNFNEELYWSAGVLISFLLLLTSNDYNFIETFIFTMLNNGKLDAYRLPMIYLFRSIVCGIVMYWMVLFDECHRILYIAAGRSQFNNYI